MKTPIIISFLVFSFLLSTYGEKHPVAHEKIEKIVVSTSLSKLNTKKDSIYFTLESKCNIMIYFPEDSSASVTIDKSTFYGKMRKSKHYDDYPFYYHFYSNDSLILAVQLDKDGDFLLLNQRYPFHCDGQKGISLVREGSKENFQKFQKYVEYYENIFEKPNELNDKAYYLEQAGIFEEAAFILEKVVKKFPDRTVAYLNLGDSYWGLEDKQKAKDAYHTYISFMKKAGKEAKVPKRVYERVQ